MRQGTIAAISTPPGKGGVAIIRMSGNGAFEIADRVFVPRSGKAIADYPPRTQIYGYVIYNEEKIDDGLLTRFPAPGSYTGEDTVEIACHGGVLITRTVLESLFAAGAVPAEAGEFTRRAFIAGKLSLTEAEAIGTLLEAKSQEQITLSAEPARTRLSARIEEIRKDITDLLSSIFARIDYPDEDLGDLTDEETLEGLLRVKGKLSELISTYRVGRVINEGVSAVICGKPNVGKSTLYNLLVGEEAAIVTDVAGTTRDLIERTVPLGKVLLRLSDTAGLREGGDKVERIGIERTKARIEAAELIFAVFDLSRPFDGEDEEVLALIRESSAAKVCILSKADICPSEDVRNRLSAERFDALLEISAAQKPEEAIRILVSITDRLFIDEKISISADAVVASARQHGSLRLAEGFIDTAIEAYRLGIPADAAAADIERALGAIGDLDGRGVSDSVVSDIFAKFCVGK